MKISFDSSDLIEEIEQDIAEFGADKPAWAIWETREVRVPFSEGETVTARFLVSWLLGSARPKPHELHEGDEVELMTLTDIRELLVAQDKII